MQRSLFTNSDITFELLEQALSFFGELHEAILDGNPKEIETSKNLQVCLTNSTPITFKDLEPQLKERFDTKTQALLQSLEKRTEIFKAHLAGLRTSEDILQLSSRQKIDFLESLYVNVLNRAVIAFYSQIAFLGGITISSLEKAYPEDAEFFNSDFLTVGKLLRTNGAPFIIAQHVAKAYNNPDEPTFLMSFLHLVIIEMLNDSDLIENYTSALKTGAYSIVHTKNPNVLMKAKELFLGLLNLPFAPIQKLLRYYHLMDQDEKKIQAIQGDDFLQKQNEEQENTSLKSHLSLLFPKKVLIFPYRNWGFMLYNGEIGLHNSFFGQYETTDNIVKAMFVLIHELGHLKKFTSLAQRNYLYQSPEPVKYHPRSLQSGTTGTLLEKQSFEGNLWIENITDHIASQLYYNVNNKTLTEEKWSEIEAALIQPVKGKDDQVSGYSKRSKKVKSFKGMCGLETHQKNLLMSFAEAKFNRNKLMIENRLEGVKEGETDTLISKQNLMEMKKSLKDAEVFGGLRRCEGETGEIGKPRFINTKKASEEEKNPFNDARPLITMQSSQPTPQSTQASAPANEEWRIISTATKKKEEQTKLITEPTGGTTNNTRNTDSSTSGNTQSSGEWRK